jgi:glycosyltransferase involved in cell wall biosynthesis
MRVIIKYLHGRPGSHPLHYRFAKSITTDHDFIDSYFRWHDKNFPFPVNALAWFINALGFVSLRKYQLVLIDGLHIMPILAKKLFLRNRTLIIAHLGSHSLYFLRNKKFGKLNTAVLKWALKNHDYLICEGEMAKELCIELLGKSCPPSYVSFLGPPAERSIELSKSNIDLDTYNIVAIASGPSRFREFYKGMDVMLEAVLECFKTFPDIKFHIIGNWEGSGIKEKYQDKRIVWHGHLENPTSLILQNSLCIHLSRGDAFPTSTIECMTAGIPVIMSNLTGTKQILAQAIPEFIVDLDSKIAADKINEYFRLSSDEKKAISEKIKYATIPYTEEKAIERYKDIFEDIFNNIDQKAD